MGCTLVYFQILCILCLCWSRPLYALSLEEAIHIGLTQHPEIQRLTEEAQLQQEGMAAQQAQLQPQWEIIGHGSFGNNIQELRTGPAWRWKNGVGTQMRLELLDGVGTSAGPAAAWQVEQPLIRGAGTLVNQAPRFESEQYAKLQRLTQSEIYAQLTLQIAQAYYRWQQALYTLQLQEKDEAGIIRFVRSVHARIEAGRLPAVDAAQADAQLLQHRLQVMQAQRQSAQAYTQLWLQIGVNPPQEPPKEVPVPLPEILLAGEAYYQDIAVSRSRWLERLRVEEMLIQRRKKVAENNAKIDLRVRLEGGVHGDRDNPTSFGHGAVPSWSGALVWTIPLGEQLATTHPIHQEDIALRQVRRQQEELTRQLHQKIKQLWENADSQRQQWKLYQESRDLAVLNCQNAHKKLDAGRQSIFEVIGLCEQQTRSHTALMEVQMSYIQTVYALEEASGIWMDRWEGTHAH